MRCELQHLREATAYKQKWDSIHNIIRSSTSSVLMDHAVEPLKAAVTQMGPDIEELCKERNKHVLDFDSFRRRLKALEAKREDLEVMIRHSRLLLLRCCYCV